jgi:hypothetical protein
MAGTVSSSAWLASSVAVLSTLLACSSGSSHTPSAPQSTDAHVSIGPIPLAASQETTVCIVVPLGNTEDLALHGFDMNLAPGSHHLIAYLTGADPVSTPYPCAPFTGVAFGTDVPIAFANSENISFAFPEGVAMDVPAGSNVKIEAHYINATANELQGQGNVTFHATTKATTPAYQAANFLAFGTLKINIPPGASYSTGPIFQAAPPGMHLVMVTTHEHRLGTRAQVWSSAQSGDFSKEIADDKDWATPAWRSLSPQVDFDGTNGLTYQCDWNNTTNQTVSFGESALDEMCIIAGYYYPSQGIYGCVDGHCRFR